jgi:hypothetical protein
MRNVPILVCCLAVTALPACGSKGSSSFVGSSTEVGAGNFPAAAITKIEQPSEAQICNSPVMGFSDRLRFPVRMTETAGLGENVVLIRFVLLLRQEEVARAAIAVADIIAQLGTNRVAANGSLSGTLTMDFNGGNFDAGRLLFEFTDDKRNNIEVPFDVPMSSLKLVRTCTI